METKRNSAILPLAMTAVMTALTCVLAPMSIPIGPVPFSLTNFVIYLSLYVLGWKWGTVSYVAYLLLGMVGMPVFSGFSGGLGRLAGPTGGYLVGFIPMAIIAGLIITHTKSFPLHYLAMAVGTAVCHAFGTVWYCIQAQSAVGPALALCVWPFIPVDLIKMAVAMVLGPVLRSRLEAAGLAIAK